MSLEQAAGKRDVDGRSDIYSLAIVLYEMLAGQYDEALDLLERLHDKADFTTSGWLRIDPEWTPLHGNPRFEKLIAGS